MFIGRYYHNLEENGRLSLPKSFREQCQNWIVTRGLDGGLFLFTQDNFQEQVAKLSQKSFTQKKNRDFVRYMVNDARLVSVDKLGRLQLPDSLITFGSLTKEVVITGSYEYIEIWDQQKYHSYLDLIEKNGEALAEAVGELENDN
jgi:MraZ protein